MCRESLKTAAYSFDGLRSTQQPSLRRVHTLCARHPLALGWPCLLQKRACVRWDVGTFLAHGPPSRGCAARAPRGALVCLFVCLFVCRIAPLAVQMYQRFSVSNAQQEELLAVFEFSGALTRLATSAPGLRPMGLLHSIHGRIDTCAQTAWSCVRSRRLCVDLQTSTFSRELAHG